jgi:hypothetical protein
MAKVHRYFSVECFNKAWELIEKPNRTPAEDEEMIRLTQASLFHWTKREDCKASNMSIGYWQASRIYAMVGRADEARRYGLLCLEYSRSETPFLHAYAYEALARAEKAAGNAGRAAEYRAEASRLAESVTDEEERKYLLSDIATT